MNKKGFTTIELLVSVVIISFIAIAMFSAVLNLLKKIDSYQTDSKVTVLSGNIINALQKDMNQKKIYGIDACGCNCYDITYQDLSTKRFQVKREERLISYGGLAEKLPNDYVISNDIIFDRDSYATATSKNNTILKFSVPIYNNATGKSNSIDIAYQYDNRDTGGLAPYTEDFSNEGCYVNQPPVITLAGDSSVIVDINSTYTDAGATATDDLDGNITGNIEVTNGVNTSALGTYTVAYDVFDSEGLTATRVTRTVTVVNYINNFTYTGTVQTFTAFLTGRYKLEVWGAQGGNYSVSYSVGGKGGYAVGEVNLTANQQLNVYVGNSGTSTSAATVPGGYNGGGAGRYYGGSGGGATDIRIGGTTLYDRLIVAGGGGGGNGRRSSSYNGGGGYGGGTIGGDGTYTTATYDGKGGTQTAGGAAATYSATGTPAAGAYGSGGQGGYYSTSYGAGGGGGGWYGGGGGAYNYGAGGGGSSYVWTAATAGSAPGGYLVGTSYYLANASTIAGNATMPNPAGGTQTGQSGTGYARITYLP